MAYSFQPLDQALESLGFSYVDGVGVKVASKYCLDCDLSEVASLLSAPAPSVLSFDSNYDLTLETQVLADIEKRAKDEELKKLERQKRIEQYETEKAEELARRQKEAEEKALEDERRRLQEIEDEKKARLAEEERLLEENARRKKQEDEEEWRRFEEERLEESRRESESCDRSEDDSVAAEFQTPPQEPQTQPADIESSQEAVQLQPPPGQILVKPAPSQNQNFNPQNINFSDFEATSDPFADLELKSINDLAELQTILSHNNYSKPSPALNPAFPAPPAAQQAGGSTYYPALPAQQTPSQALQSRLAQTGQNFNPNFVNFYSPGAASATAYNPGQFFCPQFSHSQYGPPANLPPATNSAQDQSKARSVSSDRRTTEKLKDSSSEPSGSEELKPSRSLGDMISELQKEAEEHQQQKRKSPGSRPGSRGPTGLENWTPWPQLEPQAEATLPNGGQEREREDASCLASLPPEQASLCRQLQEMGFPLTRLATGCKAVGPDSQKLINFCLVVDRWVEQWNTRLGSYQVFIFAGWLTRGSVLRPARMWPRSTMHRRKPAGNT